VTWLADPVRRIRHGRVAFLGVAFLVGVTTFLAVAGPRAFERISQDGVQEALAAIPTADRVVELSRTDRNDQPQTTASVDLAGIDAEGAAFKAGFPPSLGAVLGTATAVVETPSYAVVEGSSLATEMRLRIMEGAADHIRLDTGHAPTTKVGSAPDPLHSGGSPGEPSPSIPEFEAEISKVAADKLGLTVGARLTLVPQTVLDSLAGGGAVAVKIVGIFEPTDAADPYWIDDARVTGFTLRELSANTTLVQSTVLVAPELYPALVTGITMQGGTSGGITIAPPSRRVTWRYAPAAGQILPADIGDIVDGLRRLEGIYPVNSLNPDALSLQTGLLRQLVALQGPWNAAGAVLRLAAAGAAMVALVCLGLVIAMTGEERRRIFLLQRERGASMLQSIVALLVEALLVSVPAVVIGAFMAVRLVPEGSDQWVIDGAVGVAGATILLEILAILRAVVGPPRVSARPEPARPGVRARRLVLEGVIVVVAITGAEMLRRRGLQGAAPSAASPGAGGVLEPTAIASADGPDPILAIVPVLVGLAAGIVAIRLAQFPLAAIAWLGARMRGLGWVLASRRAARGVWASRVLLIILPIATLGAFASATLVHVARSADLQSWQDVGAPYRVDAATDRFGGGYVLPKGLDGAGVPGVSAAVRANLDPIAVSNGGQRELVALDVAAYARMLAGSPVAVSLPAEILATPTLPAAGAPEWGSAGAPLPAIVSAGAVGPYRGFTAGDVFNLMIDTQQLTFRAIDVRDGFPGLPPGRPFIIVSWPQLDAAAPGRLVDPTSLYLAAPPDAGPVIAAYVHQAAPDAVVSSHSSRANALVGQSVVGVLSAGILALAAIAVAYAALAVVAAFILTAAARVDEAAHLATLGLSDRQSRWMLVIEFGPPVLLAVLAGTALGLGLFAYLAPGLGFETILGVLQTAPPGIDPVQIGLLALVIGAILLLGVALGAPAGRRAAWSSVRRGLR
jgi:putative ABC transport system permease protein